MVVLVCLLHSVVYCDVRCITSYSRLASGAVVEEAIGYDLGCLAPGGIHAGTEVGEVSRAARFAGTAAGVTTYHALVGMMARQGRVSCSAVELTVVLLDKGLARAGRGYQAGGFGFPATHDSCCLEGGHGEQDDEPQPGADIACREEADMQDGRDQCAHAEEEHGREKHAQVGPCSVASELDACEGVGDQGAGIELREARGHFPWPDRRHEVRKNEKQEC